MSYGNELYVYGGVPSKQGSREDLQPFEPSSEGRDYILRLDPCGVWKPVRSFGATIYGNWHQRYCHPAGMFPKHPGELEPSRAA